MERILASPAFVSSRRLTDLLRLIADESIAGRAHALRERAIAVQALGRPDTFDPRVDPAVRVQVGRLRTALDRYYGGDGAADPIRVVVPKGGYRAVFVPTPHLATPVVSTRAWPGAEITVLAFEARTATPGPDERAGSLAASLAEAVVVALSRFPLCRVSGPAHGAPPPTTAEGPRGGGRLAATVGVDGGRVRVAARLTSDTGGTTRWSHVYERDLGDGPLAVQDDLAASIAGAVGDLRGAAHREEGLPPGTVGGTVPDAVRRYLRWLDRLDVSEAGATVESLAVAATLEPADPVVLALLADAHRLRAFTALLPTPTLSADLALRALAADPVSAMATCALAWADLDAGDVALAQAGLDATLALAPDHPFLLASVAFGTARLGQWDRAVTLAQRATHLNPAHPGWHRFLLVVDAYDRGDGIAAQRLARAIDTPGWLLGPLARALALVALGRRDEARTALAGGPATTPAWDSDPCAVLERLGVEPARAELAARALLALG